MSIIYSYTRFERRSGRFLRGECLLEPCYNNIGSRFRPTRDADTNRKTVFCVLLAAVPKTRKRHKPETRGI